MPPSATGSAPTCVSPPPSRNVDTTSVSSSETAATTRTTAARSCQMHSGGSGEANLSEPIGRRSVRADRYRLSVDRYGNKRRVLSGRAVRVCTRGGAGDATLFPYTALFDLAGPSVPLL